MKKLLVLLFVTLMSTSVFSTNVNPEKKEIRTKIVQLLGNPDFSVEKEVSTVVELLVNKKGEIVILNINCESPSVCDYIKSKLNYKKISKGLKNSIRIYKMPLKIKKG